MHFSPRNPNSRVNRIIFQVPLNSDYVEFTVLLSTAKKQRGKEKVAVNRKENERKIGPQWPLE